MIQNGIHLRRFWSQISLSCTCSTYIVATMDYFSFSCQVWGYVHLRLWLSEEYLFIILTFFKLTPFSRKIPWDPSLPNSTGWKYLLAGFMLDPSVAPKKRDQQEALPQSVPLSEWRCHRSRQSSTCEHIGGDYISICPCHCTVKHCRVSCYTKHTHGQTGHRGEGGKKWSQNIKRCRKTAGKVKRRSDLIIRHLRQLPLSNWTLLTAHWLAKVSVTEQFCLGAGSPCLESPGS